MYFLFRFFGISLSICLELLLKANSLVCFQESNAQIQRIQSKEKAALTLFLNRGAVKLRNS